MTSPNSIPGLFESLKSTIREWIQDKIDIATAARDEALGYRNNANTYRAGAQAAQAAAETAAANSANAAANAVEQRIIQLVGQAPETLDTLEEFANALGGDPNFSTTVFARLGEKADTSDVNAALGNKSDKGHKHVSADITDAVDASTGSPAAGKLARFNQSGTILVSRTPSGSTELVNKGYVDGQVGGKADNVSMTVAEYQSGTSSNNRVIQPDRLKAAIQYHGVAQATSGSGLTLWTGTQAQFDALPSATKNAAGFIAVIS